MAGWTPEREDLLREMWAEGLSSRIIATELDTTRNAVIGKARRLNLSLRKDPYPPHKTRVYKSQILNHRLRSVAPAPPPTPEPLNVLIFDLLSHHCRYIVGKNEKGQALYCGHDKKINFYCSHHAEKCYNYEALAKVRYKSSFGHRLPGATFPQPPLALRKGTCL